MVGVIVWTGNPDYLRDDAGAAVAIVYRHP